ncbi:MAG: hypothetical protein K6G03_06750 [Lachnospiraceae bacterium]|nr:hypothetical protein [Lachnospiraceae bacterium]
MKMTIRALLTGLMVFMVMLTGCGASGVTISDEDVKKVADYSSDVVSQHSQKSESRLVDVWEVKRKYQQQLDLEIKKQNFKALEAIESGAADESSESGEGSEGEGEGGYVEPEMTLAEAIGVPDFEIYYTGYEVSSSYPTEASVSGDVYMGMTAAPGDKLLIMHFNLSNTQGLDRECYILGLKPTFRVKINGENHTVQQTILTNDLSKFDGTVPAYSSVDTVLISETTEATVEDISSLSLVVRSAEGRPEYKLE